MMRKLISLIRQDKRGVTAIEYGLIAAFIALLVIGGVSLVGSNLSKQFSSIAASV